MNLAGVMFEHVLLCRAASVLAGHFNIATDEGKLNRKMDKHI